MGDLDNPIKVSIGQFYGIEINDFAVTVAKTALWISEAQAMQETENIVHMSLDFLPLKSYANIVEGNALRLDWADVIPPDKCDYIMGNPPFVANAGRTANEDSHSKAMLDNEQREDRKKIFGASGGVLDYVACWHKVASEYMQGTKIKAAFVSTNSICQGQQVAPLWKPLFEKGIKINFAHQTFKWVSESGKAATVFVVIVGFSYQANKEAYLFSNGQANIVPHINGYLVNADDVFIEKRKTPLCDVPEMIRGSQPTDNGNLILSFEECEQLTHKEPTAKTFIRPFMMGKDFIDRKPRFCLWLVNANPSELKKCPSVLKRIDAVKEFRLKSTKAATRKKAETPMLFDEIHECDSYFVAIPKVSSGARKYIPMEYLPPEIIPGDKLFMTQRATLYHFGVLTSNVHMAWQNAVCSKYGPSYSYSNTLAYNNFPWPEATDTQKATIEKTAQGILDARAKFPNSSLADLYDETTMPPELRKAHQANDRAVMAAYGMDVKATSEASCVAELMRRYRELTEKERSK